jgi:hypothetical protein
VLAPRTSLRRLDQASVPAATRSEKSWWTLSQLLGILPRTSSAGLFDLWQESPGWTCPPPTATSSLRRACGPIACMPADCARHRISTCSIPSGPRVLRPVAWWQPSGAVRSSHPPARDWLLGGWTGLVHGFVGQMVGLLVELTAYVWPTKPWTRPVHPPSSQSRGRSCRLFALPLRGAGGVRRS